MCFAIVLGLFLSSNGATGGLTSMNGQDLELFKKTKDKGLVKILQALFYIVLILALSFLIYNYIITK
jgi:preprotein translocase subunit SecG